MSPPETISLTYEQYRTLVERALISCNVRATLKFLDAIEEANNFRTYRMHIRWVELGAKEYPSQRFPAEWPPSNQTYLEQFRPISRADVLAAIKLSTQASVASIRVTTDPAAELGWSLLDQVLP